MWQSMLNLILLVLTLFPRSSSLISSHNRIINQKLNQKRSCLLQFSSQHLVKLDESLNKVHSQCIQLKCPFLRRRTTDTVENIMSILRFILVRHKSTPFFPIFYQTSVKEKWCSLPIEDIALLIFQDWSGHSKDKQGKGKGYYITGRLTENIYQEDCFFNGPDPDMPVRGLKKYLLAASHLFDRKKSRADLKGPLVIDYEKREITAYWRLEGILNLPWHPFIKPWTGCTVYRIDENGLIYEHVEKWDISVFDAFISTLFPQLNYGASPAMEFQYDYHEPFFVSK